MVNEVRVNNLEWREFLKAFRELNPDNPLGNIIEPEFLNAEYLIDCMSNSWDLQTQIPRINVDSFFGSKNNSSKLYYDPEDMTINISSELVSEYFKDKNPIELEKARNEFLWGIAHEFFHHGRNHVAVWNHYGITKYDTSSQYNHILRFLEDDVDRLATKALYRHFLFHVYKGLYPYNLKLKALNVLFNTIRIKIDNEKSTVTKHPAWATRLYSQVIELSEIDNTNNDPQNPNIRFTKKTHQEQILLTEELIKMENLYDGNFDLRSYYFKPVSIPSEDNVLIKFILDNPRCQVTQVGLDLHYLNNSHKELDYLLKTHSNLPGLNKSIHESLWQSKQDN